VRVKKRKRGFTLVELIISIAIIAILLVAMMTSFAGSFKQVFLNGSRTKSVFEAQSKIDNIIAEVNSVSGDSQVSVQAYDMQIKLYSTDGSKSITSGTISGNVINVNMNDKNKVTLSTFVPNE
jgi:prepilin-type N-terminal cleavage/methylation domain-containing protein